MQSTLCRPEYQVGTARAIRVFVTGAVEFQTQRFRTIFLINLADLADAIVALL